MLDYFIISRDSFTAPHIEPVAQSQFSYKSTSVGRVYLMFVQLIVSNHSLYQVSFKLHLKLSCLSGVRDQM